MTALHIAAGALIATLALAPSDDLLQKFHARYRGLTTLSCSFRGSNGISGTILAKRGGMYRIAVGERTVVSNGKTVWNATTSSKTVIVSQYKPASTDVSIERVFFDVMSVYRSSIQATGAHEYTVRFDAPNPQVQIAGISSVEVQCSKQLVVRSVRINAGGTTSDFSITKFTSNPRVTSADFTYTIPKNWQLVDLSK